jgi:PIN domain nuclease of toxin-antitoxin system
MDILVDTQSFIWFCDGDEKLPSEIRNVMNDKENKLRVSIASLWEITIKMSIEKLILSCNIAEILDMSYKNGFDILPIKPNHLVSLFGLKFIHKDPFDRMIIAQGISENIPIISSDSVFKGYPVQVIW